MNLFHLFGKFGIGHLLSRLSLGKQDCHKVQQPATSITPIFLFGGTHH